MDSVLHCFYYVCVILNLTLLDQKFCANLPIVLLFNLIILPDSGQNWAQSDWALDRI